jgi:hypothetical protein
MKYFQYKIFCIRLPIVQNIFRFGLRIGFQKEQVSVGGIHEARSRDSSRHTQTPRILEYARRMQNILESTAHIPNIFDVVFFDLSVDAPHRLSSVSPDETLSRFFIVLMRSRSRSCKTFSVTGSH